MNVYKLITSTPDNTELEIVLKKNKISYYHLSWTDNSILRVMLGNGNVVDVRQGIR
jgi:hypothetical protein